MTSKRQCPQASTNAGPQPTQRSLSCPLRPLSLSLILVFAGSALALPSDPALIAGQATVSRTGPTQLVINQSSAKAALDWRSFNVGANEAVRFNQPSASALTVNRVTGNDPSQILGRISAPGSVFLINPAGVYFGASAVVHVGNLIAGTLGAQPLDLLNGRLSFSRTSGSAASVRNDGRLETPIGGSVSLLGSEVINAGSISTPGGTTGLIAGDRIVVDFHGDGLVRYQVDAAAARALVSNPGRIDADGGRIALQASARDALVDTVLNVEGIVRARGARQHKGEIYLDGGSSGVVSVSGQLDAASREPAAAGGQISVLGDKVGIFGSAQLDASGDAGGGRILIGGDYQGKGSVRTAQQTYVGKDATITADALSTGQGGKIIVWADDWTRFSGSISARGGQQHGDGGFVEVSGKQNLGFDGHVDTSAPHGSVGSLLLDPSDLYVGGEQLVGEQTLSANPFIAPSPGDPDTVARYFVAAGSFGVDASYTLQASRDVILRENVSFATTGSGTPPTSVTITAGNALNAGGFRLRTAGGGLTLTAATVTSPGAMDVGGGTLTINLSSGSMTQAQPITAASLVKEGPGTLRFLAPDVLLGNAGSASNLALNAGTVDLNGNRQSLGRLSGAGNLVLGGATLGVSIAAGPDATFSGVISGAGTLSKVGAGRLVLSGANNVLAGTNIEAGMLELSGANNATGATRVNGGTLKLSGTGSLAASALVSLADGVGAVFDLAQASQNQEIAGLSGGAAGLAPDSAGRVALGDRTLTVSVAGGGSGSTFAGSISGSSTGSLSKQGAGTLTLSGANTYRGTTRVGGGVLALTRGDALHAESALVVDGGTLQLGATLNTLAGGFSLRGDGGGLGALRVAAAGNAAYLGDITLSGAASIAVGAAGTLELGGAISQDVGEATYALSKTEAGTLRLSGIRKDYRGGTEIVDGRLVVAAGDVLPTDRSVNLAGGGALLELNGTTQHIGRLTGVSGARVDLGTSGWLYVKQAADGEFAGTISGNGGKLNKLGGGRLLLSQANTYSGATTVSQGVLAVARSDALHADSTLVVDGGTSGVGNDGGSLEIAESVVLNTLNGGAAGSFRLGGVGQGGNGALRIAAGKTGGYAGAITLTGPSLIGGEAAAPLDGTRLTLSGGIGEDAAGASLSKVGLSTLVLSGAASNYSGGTFIQAGVVAVQDSAALGPGSIEVTAGSSLRLENAALAASSYPQVKIAGRGVALSGVDQGALIGTGNSASYNGRVLLAGNAAVAVGSGDRLALNGAIDEEAGSRSLSKLGGGTLVLGGPAKSYTGGTQIEAGTLETAAANVLPGSGMVTLSDAAAAVLDLANRAQRIGGLRGGAAADAQDNQLGKVLLGNATLTVEQKENAGFAGQIEGTGSLTKLGDATLTLQHANLYSGTTTVSRGVLGLTKANALDTRSDLVVEDGGTLELDGSFTLNPLAGGFSLAGAGHPGRKGALTVAAGPSGTAYAAGYDGPLTLMANAAVGGDGTAQTAGSLTLRGDIAASPGNAGHRLTKLGPATLVLAGSGTDYKGGTDIEAGIVRAERARALGGGSVDVKPGATLLLAGVTLELSEPTSTLKLAGSGSDGRLGALHATGTAAYGGAIVLGGETLIGVSAADARLTLNGAIASTPHGLRKVGEGTLLLGGQAKDYAGNTVVEAGRISVTDWRSLGMGGTVEVEPEAVLELDNVALLGSRNPQIQIVGQGPAGQAVNARGALIGRSSASYDGRIVLAADAGIGVPELNHRLRLNGAIEQLAGGDRALSKFGSGTLTLAGPRKTYRGGTFIVGGTIETGADDVLPAARPLTLDAASAALDLQGHAQNIGTLTGSDPAARIWLNGGTLSVEQAVSGSFAGQIGESAQVAPATRGSLVKTGTGQLSLTGNNSYAGGTSIAAGVLVAGDSHALGSGSVDVAAGATLAIDNVGLTLGPTAELRIAGAGAGGSLLGAGALTGSGTLAVYTGAVYLAADARINVPEADDRLTLQGPVGGAPAAAMTKVGAGQLILQATASYSGGTIIEQGMLLAQANDGVLGSGAVDVVSGTLRVNDIALGNDVRLRGGKLEMSGEAVIGGLELAQSTTLSVPAGVSLEVSRALVGGGDQTLLTIDGGGTLKLFGGARRLGSLTQDAQSTLDLGSAQTVLTADGQTYHGIVKGDSVTLTSSSRGAMTIDNPANDLRGSFSVTGGTTRLSTRSPNLALHMVTGETHVQATSGALMLAGTADSLLAHSAGELSSSVATTGNSQLDAGGAASNSGHIGGDLTIEADGAIRSSGDISGGARLFSRAGETISHVGAVGGRLSSETTGDTMLAGSFGELQVERSAQLTFGPATTRVANAARIAQVTGRISQSAALTVAGPLVVSAPSQEVKLDTQENDFASVDITAATTRITDRDALAVKLLTADTTLHVLAGELSLAGSATNLTAESEGPLNQSAALIVPGALRIRAPGWSVRLASGLNDFGEIELVAGRTHIADRNGLAARLETGETTIDLLAGDLVLAGSAASLVASSTLGSIASVTTIGPGDAVLTSGAGGSINHAGSVGGRLSTDTTGPTRLSGSFGSLQVRQAGALSFGPQATRVDSSAELLSVTGEIGQSGSLSVANGLLTIRAAGRNVELRDPQNDFSRIDLVAGPTLIADQNGFSATLRTGSTNLRALAGALTISGQASTLEARSEGATGDLTSNVSTSGNSTLSTGGGAIVHAADVGGRLTTSTPGQTVIAGTLDALSVVQSGALRFGLTTVNQEATISLTGELTQTAGLQVNQATTIDAATHSVTLDSADNRFVGGLRLTAGDSQVRTGGALEVLLDTGSTRLDAERLQVAGQIRAQPGLRSHLISATTVELGPLVLSGAGIVDIVANQAEMPSVIVPKVSVQDASGVPAQLAVYGSSIHQATGALLQSAPEVTVNLFARRASIDLTAGATAASAPVAGQQAVDKSGPGGLIEVYAAPQDRQALAHPGGLTNRLQGPLSAVTEVDANQTGNRKSVVAIAADTITVAATPLPAIDADTVLLLARSIRGGGGKIQTRVGASQLRDGRNLATDPERRDDNAFSILPSIFVIADVNAALPAGSPSSLQFGELGAPISLSFGAVSGVANNSWLQTIAVDPFRQDLTSGDVPVYLATSASGGVDPTGVIARRLVYPASLATTAVRPVIVDGRRIEDSSAYDAVQSGVADVLNQVRKEQLESGFSNENVAAQLRKGVITETRVGQAAVSRFQGVGSVPACVGLTVGDRVVCVPAAGGSDKP